MDIIYQFISPTILVTQSFFRLFLYFYFIWSEFNFQPLTLLTIFISIRFLHVLWSFILQAQFGFSLPTSLCPFLWLLTLPVYSVFYFHLALQCSSPEPSLIWTAWHKSTLRTLTIQSLSQHVIWGRIVVSVLYLPRQVGSSIQWLQVVISSSFFLLPFQEAMNVGPL